ncbi:MAG: hypothetical protein KGD65_02420 [Candidatus Lokiarchaeota archaeon]|nr:hypothetical protein [Candidatus Lokiarchaeota archaeon]
MPEEFVEDKEGMKIRKLVELRTTTAEEYEKVMLERVEEFKNKNAEKSIYNNFLQNTIVSGIGALMNIKLEVDKALGEENLKKVHKVIDDILLTGL